MKASLAAPRGEIAVVSRVRAIIAALVIGSGLCCSTALADARSEYLIRLLEGSSQFRVRAQAAISLGSVETAAPVTVALTSALRDEHPAVRAAAANSLGRLSDTKSLPALRAAARDPEGPVQEAARAAITKLEGEARRASATPVEAPRPVPTGPPRYYVAVGKPASRVPELTSATLDQAHRALMDRLEEIDGVVLAPSNESNAAARTVLRKRSLKGFYIESAVTSIAPKSGGTRAAVSVIVATYPDRAMRAIMQGSATAIGGGDTRVQALLGAFKSALNQLPQAIGPRMRSSLQFGASEAPMRSFYPGLHVRSER